MRPERAGAFVADAPAPDSDPDAPEVALQLETARAFVQEGAFDQARALFEQCVESDPCNPRALFGLSAMRRHLGKTTTARRLLERAVALEPVSGPARHDGDKPTVVRTRCTNSGAYRIGRRRNGTYRMLFKGGHFSLKHLLDHDSVNLYVANFASECADALDHAPAPDLLINTIACADRGRRSLASLCGYLAERPQLAVVNRPEAVMRTSRDENCRRLNAIENVRFPRTERLRVDREPLPMAARIEAMGFGFPVILRATGRHTGSAMWLCKDRPALEAALVKLGQDSEAYLVKYRDCRDASGFYRKARAFFIDGRTYPVAYLANDQWQIHSGDRYRVMSQTPSMQAEEQRYLADPAAFLGQKAYAALEAVGEVLDLDFAGIDFTVTPQGELFVFEANPAMRHNFDHASAFPYTRPHLETISGAFEAMVLGRAESDGGAARPTIAPSPGSC